MYRSRREIAGTAVWCQLMGRGGGGGGCPLKEGQCPLAEVRLYGPVGYSAKFYMGRLRPEVQTLTLLCTIFDRKGTPFAYFP